MVEEQIDPKIEYSQMIKQTWKKGQKTATRNNKLYEWAKQNSISADIALETELKHVDDLFKKYNKFDQNSLMHRVKKYADIYTHRDFSSVVESVYNLMTTRSVNPAGYIYMINHGKKKWNLGNQDILEAEFKTTSKGEIYDGWA